MGANHGENTITHCSTQNSLIFKMAFIFFFRVFVLFGFLFYLLFCLCRVYVFVGFLFFFHFIIPNEKLCLRILTIRAPRRAHRCVWVTYRRREKREKKRAIHTLWLTETRNFMHWRVQRPRHRCWFLCLFCAYARLCAILPIWFVAISKSAQVSYSILTVSLFPNTANGSVLPVCRMPMKEGPPILVSIWHSFSSISLLSSNFFFFFFFVESFFWAHIILFNNFFFFHFSFGWKSCSR